MGDDFFERFVMAICGLVMAVVVGLIGYAIWYAVNDPGHGTITKTEYVPEHTDVTTSCINNVCTPQFHHYAECYSIHYTDGHNDGDACVTRQEYETYRVGEQYPHPKQPG